MCLNPCSDSRSFTHFHSDRLKLVRRFWPGANRSSSHLTSAGSHDWRCASWSKSAAPTHGFTSSLPSDRCLHTATKPGLTNRPLFGMHDYTYKYGLASVCEPCYHHDAWLYLIVFKTSKRKNTVVVTYIRPFDPFLMVSGSQQIFTL